MDDTAFRGLLEFLGLSWRGYRKVRRGLKKRVARDMAECGCRTVEQYIRLLERNKALKDHCEMLMGVSISRFFRDRALWETLEKDILPELSHRHPDRLSVWCAGCACGEEVYSLKILWEEIKSRLDPIPLLRILATDMNPAFLARARIGLYPRSSLKEVSDFIRQRYFLEQGDQTFAVKPFIKDGICWEQGNLLFSVPQESFHLIFMRNNLLTYYAEGPKVSAFQKVLGCLEPGGYLVIGSHEKIPPGTKGLRRVEAHPSILLKEAN
ncbi:MAG: hypothetical protein JRJ03_02015 [Deltaproteobacteria bacterium]|nr:hypothetical protein [Deltaproteobacteria bacterium]